MSAAGSFDLIRLILRTWYPYLSSAELHILLFIYDRTALYNKVSEIIPIRHFLEGIKDFHGTQIRPKINIKRSMLYKAMKSLKNKNILICNREGQNLRYSINPRSDFLEKIMAQKGLKSCDNRPLQRTMPSTTADNLVHSSGLPIYNMRKHENKGLVNTSYLLNGPTDQVDIGTIKDRVKSAIAGAKEKFQTARKKNIDKNLISMYEKCWYESIKEHFPNNTVIGFTQAQRAMMKNIVKRGLSEIKPDHFFDVVIGNWKNIIRIKFSKLKSSLEVPSFSFIVKFIDQFIAAFHQITKDTFTKDTETVNVSIVDQMKKKLDKQVELSSMYKTELEALKKEKKINGNKKLIARKKITAKSKYGFKEW